MKARDKDEGELEDDDDEEEEDDDDEEESELMVDNSLPPLPPPKAKVSKYKCRKDSLPAAECRAIIGSNPAITYPFSLDTFQLQAVARLHQFQSVFVSAHTSSGKTLVSEYGAMLSIKRGRRAIYTSPIKALSNQKFRDFQGVYGAENVGIITGDVQINQGASLLIMTTEVLRSMLYRGSDVIKDTETVIFDECHYLNDPERGVVYEECIVMLGSKPVMIFLSATTDNGVGFCDWVAGVTGRDVHFIETRRRVVPLIHELYVGGSRFAVKVGEGRFEVKGWEMGKDKVGKKGGRKVEGRAREGRGGRPAWQEGGGKGQWQGLVRHMEKEELLPGIVFSFSKRKCQEIADWCSSLTLNSKAEEAQVVRFGNELKSRLSDKDASLPQVLHTINLARAGMGVHHGGMLPVLKEVRRSEGSERRMGGA